MCDVVHLGFVGKDAKSVCVTSVCITRSDGPPRGDESVAPAVYPRKKVATFQVKKRLLLLIHGAVRTAGYRQTASQDNQ